jgi:hypothetical protein
MPELELSGRSAGEYTLNCRNIGASQMVRVRRLVDDMQTASQWLLTSGAMHVDKPAANCLRIQTEFDADRIS